MVSGFFTSPYDHSRIRSGEAILIRIESKAMAFGFSKRLRASAVPALPSIIGFSSTVNLHHTGHASMTMRNKLNLACYALANPQLPGGRYPLEPDHALLAVLALDKLDVQTQALELLDEHVERLRKSRFQRMLTFDDCFIYLCPSGHVVGLDREELLQAVCGAVCLESPDFHFAQPLSAELGLAAQRLLGDERVGAYGPRVQLVVDEMVQLQHVHVSHGHRLVELVPGPPVVQLRLAGFVEFGLFEHAANIIFLGAVEHRRGHVQAQGLGCPAQMGLENLPHVHTGRNARSEEHTSELQSPTNLV